MGDKGYFIVQGAVVVVLAMLMVTATGCEVIGGIFKAGLWTAVIVIALLIAGILLVMRMFKK